MVKDEVKDIHVKKISVFQLIPKYRSHQSAPRSGKSAYLAAQLIV
jgi:hypothetical protein